ncbi:MAG TPA: glycosyltransferase [Jatrophihabitans sp.]|nr:glycosyltransferase [Jatrophihabitans sp.]
MRILLWHLHGSWMTAFVQGRHDYLVPVTPDRGEYGLGRARTWQWPASVREVTPAQLAQEPVDVVILQRPEELALCQAWLGRRPGPDVPAVYLEHNTPRGQRHPVADRADLRLVHVTHFNELYWDSGQCPTTVIEHGVIDPGQRYTGELERVGVVINDPVRRGREVGADLLPRFSDLAPIDLFGMRAAQYRAPAVQPFEDLADQQALHRELARRRLYLHPVRWTSLGLSLIEAMLLGLPVVAVAATEVPEAIDPQAGVISTDLQRLRAGVRLYLNEPEAARLAGKAARQAALRRFGLTRFLSDWDRVLHEAKEDC